MITADGVNDIVKTDNNKIPDGVKSIHFIAVCGTGMGALAAMLRDMGYKITGSDKMVYPPMSDFLRGKGIEIIDGFKGENLDHKPDLVVVGNAVSSDNPEVVRLAQMELCYCSMPQALNWFVAKGKKAVLICGTHGKTTTSSMMAWVLYQAGLDPSFMIGGLVKDFDSNYRLGDGEFIVIEGDEYDTAFFDKGAKFLHYDPWVAVLGNIEFDHADIFRDLDHVKDTFKKLISGISSSGTLLSFDGDKNIDDLFSPLDKTCFVCQLENYGSRKGSKWTLGTVTVDPPWNKFEVLKDGKHFWDFKMKMTGRHNLLNALAVIGTADKLGVSSEITAKAFESFSGIKRRQEIRGIKRGITVMDDFAHHPTAVRETIKAVKPFYSDGRLIAVFEPRTNTSMRAIFQNIYPNSFDEADLIVIREPSMLSKIAEGNRFSSQILVDNLKAKGKDAFYFSDTDLIIQFLCKEVREGDLVLIDQEM